MKNMISRFVSAWQLPLGIFQGLSFALFTFATIVGDHSDARAQFHGSRGPTFVRSAWNLEPGYLTLYGQTRFYGKVGQYFDPALGRTVATTYWNVQGGASINFGISRHIEGAVMPIFYQDTNRKGRGFNIPDDIFLRMKIGSLGDRGAALSYGVEIASRIPTGELHNLPLEPYSGDKVSFGATAMLSYARDPLYPEESINFHLNLGYWNHNDVGSKLTDLEAALDTILVSQMTQEFNYGAALVLPSDRFNFRLEFYGYGFITRPPATAYSREAVAYFSPGVTYKPYRWMALDFSIDIRTTSNNDATLYQGIGNVSELPNYPTWRGNLGVKVTLLPTSLYSVSERDLLMKKAESRRELFEQIIKEQRETESAEAELDRIKQERRKAERELERLRRILEGEARRQQDDNPYSEDNNNGKEPPRE